MNNQKMLSGYEIVAKGAAKIEVTLPQLGIKDIFPNRTWLEEKQIHAAIEARKHLIEVERIDKSGVLSHAVWREELMLAEVTQKVGSYWQYLGHNVGNTLFLKPEEALFLLETSNLSLNNNDMKVSLQQAYSLLLRDKVTLLQYKVYASLSRLGYRVYRHQTTKPSTCERKSNPSQREYDVKDVNKEKNNDHVVEENYPESFTEFITSPLETLQQCCTELQSAAILNEDLKIEMPDENITEIQSCENNKSSNTSTTKNTKKQYLDNNIPSCSYHYQSKHKKLCKLKKLQKLNKRQLKPCNAEVMHNYFNNVPELLQKNIVPVKTPDKQLLPNTIVLTKPVYMVNLHNIQKKVVIPASTETNIYSVSDEVNGSHIRRLRSTSNRTESNWVPPPTNVFANQSEHFRPFHFWRPRHPFNYYNVNMMFMRPFVPGWYFAPSLTFFPRAQSQLLRLNNSNGSIANNNRKRTSKTAQKQQFEGILKLASRLKQLILHDKAQEQNIYSLQRLIQTYNMRYGTKVRLNDTFDIVDETVVDTIELDDDEGPSTKKIRPTDHVFDENLNNIKLFASRLKDLELNGKSSGRHRRAFSKLLRTFNKSHNEDYHLNDNYEVVCRNQIDLDSSESDLDCLIDETPAVSGKKLKNPFNILKRLSETQTNPSNEAGDYNKNENILTATNKKYSQFTVNTFAESWLPRENDFGRAEIISKDADYNEIIDMRREEFLYDFIKIRTCEYENWLDLKKSFFNSIQAAVIEFQNAMPAGGKMQVNSILKPEDCADMASVLKKLSIIKTEKKISDQCNLTIDFDVYNRDVQNFRKTNRPTPHFRILCMDESTNMPHGDEIAALHSRNADRVTIVFAIVGLDSISYIQINPADLPVYISNNT